MLHGTLDALVLKTLSAGPLVTAIGIAQWLEGATQDAVLIEEGSLYPALYRMERRGLIAAEWGTSELGRKAEFYPSRRTGGVSSRRDRRMGALLGRRHQSADTRRMSFGRRLRSRVWRGSVEDEVDAELQFHVEMRARELEARGLSRSEAVEAAVRRFGESTASTPPADRSANRGSEACVAPSISPN